MGEYDAIALSHITKSFRFQDEAVLEDVNLVIPVGQFVAIVGPSGAGKSTLLNILGLLDSPTSGSYLLFGRETVGLSERKRDLLRRETFGFVFQSANTVEDESAAKNAAMGLRIQKVGSEERLDTVREALDRVGLEDKSEERTRYLSGGERQRVAFARAIAGNPKVLFADEPTGNLDSKNSELITSYLRKVARDGVTVVLITHDREVAQNADRILTLRDGEIVEDISNAKDVISPEQRGLDEPADRATQNKGARKSSALVDDIADALSSASSVLLRTLLLMLAFAVGIGGLVASQGMSETAASQVDARFNEAALDEVRVSTDYDRVTPELSDQIIELERSIDRIERVVDSGALIEINNDVATAQRIIDGRAMTGSNTKVVIADTGLFDVMDVTTTPNNAGSLLSADIQGPVAIAEKQALASLGFNDALTQFVGYAITVNGKQVPLVGTFEATGRSAGLVGSVVVTPDVVLGAPASAVRLIVRTEQGFPPKVAVAIPPTLDPINPARFRTETTANLQNLQSGVSTDLAALIGWISAVLLLLVALSASATMYLSVAARKSEIALRRALGASRGAVARLFIVEGLIIGTLGGIFGAALGTLVVLISSAIQGWQPVISPTVVPIGVGLGIVAGLVSSLYPAWAASRQEPAIALRG